MGIGKEFDVRSARVPRQTQHDRTIASILILIMILQALRNRIVYILIILKLGREDPSAFGFATEQFLVLTVEKVASATHGTDSEEPEDWAATVAAAPAGLGGGRVSVTATLPLLMERMTGEVVDGAANRNFRPEGGVDVDSGGGECASGACH